LNEKGELVIPIDIQNVPTLRLKFAHQQRVLQASKDQLQEARLLNDVFREAKLINNKKILNPLKEEKYNVEVMKNINDQANKNVRKRQRRKPIYHEPEAKRQFSNLAGGVGEHAVLDVEAEEKHVRIQ
jgi:hypothetical protein